MSEDEWGGKVSQLAKGEGKQTIEGVGSDIRFALGGGANGLAGNGVKWAAAGTVTNQKTRLLCRRLRRAGAGAMQRRRDRRRPNERR